MSELSVRPFLVIESSVVPSVCPASINRSEYELSVLPVSVTELPTPASVNAPGYEHSVCTKVAFESDVELSVCFKSTPASNCELSTQSAFASVPNAERFVCSTTLNEINTELSALSVTAQKPAFAPLNQLVLCPETINASHVFHGNSVTAIETIHELATCAVAPSVSVEASALPVLVRDPVYELSFYPVSVSDSIDDWFVFPAMVPETENALPVVCLCSPQISVYAMVFCFVWWSSAPPWWSSAQVWWSSAQVWWSSAPPWWSSAQVWWSSVPSWRYSAPPWGAPVSSAPPWWAPVSSAPPWWAPVSSAPPWWAPVSSAPPWLPALRRSPATPLPRGPGPPSLPLFCLRSTALLDCKGASLNLELAICDR